MQFGERDVRFRHSLVRSAVYQGASFGERRRAHQALTEALDEERHADRRVWHRAAATLGADDELADELERSAEGTLTRGGHVAAAAALERAAAFTSDSERRARRLIGRRVRRLARRTARHCCRLAPTGSAARIGAADAGRPGARPRPDRAATGHAGAGTRDPHDVGYGDPHAGPGEGRRRCSSRPARPRTSPATSPERSRRAASRSGCVADHGVRSLEGAHDGRGREPARRTGCRGCIAPGARRSRRSRPPTTRAGSRGPASCAFVSRGRSAARRRTGAGSSTKPAVRARSRSSPSRSRTARAARRARAGSRRRSSRPRRDSGSLEETGQANAAAFHRSVLARAAARCGREEECRAQAAAVFAVARERGLGIHAGHALLALGELELAAGRPVESLSHFETLWHAGPGAGSRLGEALRSARPRRGGGPGRAARHRARGAGVLRGLGDEHGVAVRSCRSSSAAAGCWSQAPPRSSASRRRSGFMSDGGAAVRAGTHRAALRRAAAPRAATSRSAHASTSAWRSRLFEQLGAAGWCERAPRGAPRERRDRPEARSEHARPAHPAGAPDRAGRGGGRLQQTGRRTALPEPAHDRVPPQARSSQSSASRHAASWRASIWTAASTSRLRPRPRPADVAASGNAERPAVGRAARVVQWMCGDQSPEASTAIRGEGSTSNRGSH